MIRRLVFPWLAAGLLVMGGMAVFQDRLLYFPERVELEVLLAEATPMHLHAWPSTGAFRGLLREPEGPAIATLVLFHGNAGHAGHRALYADLSRLSLRVILAEYPGYGPRPGQIGEATLAADAAETIALARREFGAPVLVAGESLGSGVAASAYARVPHDVAGLLLMTPWDSLANVASHHYPWLPVNWLLRDRYDSQQHLAQATVPIAVVVAEKDSIVPARYGQFLHEQLSAPKRLWLLSGAGHNDWLLRVDDRWWADVLDFLLRDGENPSPSSGHTRGPFPP